MASSNGPRIGTSVEAWAGAAAIALAAFLPQTRPADPAPAAARSTPFFHGVLLDPDAATAERLAALAQAGATAIVFPVGRAAAAKEACAAVRARGLELGLWVEVGRAPDLAAEHPEWMASLQGHRDWRRAFPDHREPGRDEVVKTKPWVPIQTEQGFAAQLDRVVNQLAAWAPLGPIDAVFLNDLQGGPSACGCGNLLCRWTSDQGPGRMTLPLEPEAARDFVIAVGEKLAPPSGGKTPTIVPVVAPECEASDHGAEGACASVACYDSDCWRAFWQQVSPLAARKEGEGRLGLLLLARTFGRAQGDAAAPDWIRSRLDALAGADARRIGPPIPASRCLVVIEAEGRAAAAQTELAAARAAGASGALVCELPLDQSFAPWILALQR